jgi:hypothetical protein
MSRKFLDSFPAFTRESTQGPATRAGWAGHTPHRGTVSQPEAAG